MFTYHKVIYNSNNSFQLNNLLLITRNQILNNYENNIYLNDIKIKPKKKIRRKFIHYNKYSYMNISLNTLFFHQFLFMLFLYSHFEIIFLITLI